MNKKEDDNTNEKFQLWNKLKNDIEFDKFINDPSIDSVTKIVLSLEAEYEYLEISQKNIIYSNIEMKSLLPQDDEFSLESQKINIEYFNSNIEKMKRIKEKINILVGPNHYICQKQLPNFDY